MSGDESGPGATFRLVYLQTHLLTYAGPVWTSSTPKTEKVIHRGVPNPQSFPRSPRRTTTFHIPLKSRTLDNPDTTKVVRVWTGPCPLGFLVTQRHGGVCDLRERRSDSLGPGCHWRGGTTLLLRKPRVGQAASEKGVCRQGKVVSVVGRLGPPSENPLSDLNHTGLQLKEGLKSDYQIIGLPGHHGFGSPRTPLDFVP